MKIPWIRLKGGELFVVLLMCSPLSYATSQCPTEFGQKDPLINVLGWIVVAVGIIIGSILFTYIIRQSRLMRLRSRSVVIVLGSLGMLFVWGGGFVLAFVNFFFKC